MEKSADLTGGKIWRKILNIIKNLEILRLPQQRKIRHTGERLKGGYDHDRFPFVEPRSLQCAQHL